MSAPPEPNLERWRGQIEQKVGEQARRLDGLNGELERVWKELDALRVEVARLTVKVSVAAALGGVIASAITMSFFR